ncbi:hypothetical protein SFRURICE_006974 [Spodoptera frugiperda]|uniref:SFRICE_015983 n=1 Tax=Spodoptera frugiperda TaxID=7108 RepID=A0A2H1WIN1_SPOFR|nr:hypothetical protein SFRURICE_006974 [Spodoptera frugiperda]
MFSPILSTSMLLAYSRNCLTRNSTNFKPCSSAQSQSSVAARQSPRHLGRSIPTVRRLLRHIPGETCVSLEPRCAVARHHVTTELPASLKLLGGHLESPLCTPKILLHKRKTSKALSALQDPLPGRFNKWLSAKVMAEKEMAIASVFFFINNIKINLR